MTSNSKFTWSKGEVIGDFIVQFPIKIGNTAETYRVKDKVGKVRFLKLFHYSRLNRSAFDDENNLLEIEILKRVQHPNIVDYCDSGELVRDGKKFGYLVLDFITGETLAERISRQAFSSFHELTLIVLDILEGLKCLHTLADPVIHNEITPHNIMLDLSSEIPKARIIDFGNARFFKQSMKAFNKESLNLYYVASECFNGLYSPQSDIFSVGAVLYQLLFGLTPWHRGSMPNPSTFADKEKELLLARERPLRFETVLEGLLGYDERCQLVIKKALSKDLDTRFQNASEFISVLNGETEVEDIDLVQQVKSGTQNGARIKPNKPSGKGFGAIAGMRELKELLQVDVIDALHNPEEYAKYGLTIPNGMLLYGPPGCGKTFFAKHFAEEVGFNFMCITPSMLKSRYVNASQENIANMFAEAEKNAPTIIFIDEINELVPNRESDVHEMSKSAVNEMLAQMDRTGQRGVFVIGATNYPNQIDPAMLRAGRLDKKFYLPPPDAEARKLMFEMYLKNRPVDFGIDYDELARLTDHYVSADIEFLVNEASRSALKVKSKISMRLLQEVIKNSKPSVPLEELKKYEVINKKLIGEESKVGENRSRIGFR